MLKRLIKLKISLLYLLLLKLRSFGWSLTGRPRPGTCIILYYHEVPSGTRSRFAAQMDAVLRAGKVVSLDALSYPLAPGVHHLVVTFDDAFQSVFDNAVPEMARRNIPSTVFVPTGYLGSPPGWMGEGDGEVVASGETLRKHESRLVTYGSHSVTHPVMPKLDDDALRREVADSKRSLESILQKPLPFFCFPYGRHDARTVEACRKAGYKRVFTILPVPAFTSSTEYATGRVGVTPWDWGIEFRLKAAGAYGWMPAASKLKRQLRRLY